MSRTPPPIRNIAAPPPRPTLRSALWLACALSAVASPVLLLLELLVRRTP